MSYYYKTKIRELEATGGPEFNVLRETVKHVAEVFQVSPRAAGWRARELRLISLEAVRAVPPSENALPGWTIRMEVARTGHSVINKRSAMWVRRTRRKGKVEVGMPPASLLALPPGIYPMLSTR